MSSSNIDEATVVYREALHGGQMWSRIVRRGQVLRITDVEGEATPSGIFYNAAQTLERYNMPDTLKAQHIARLCKGYVLYSDMGRILFSIVDENTGWHDTITGCLDAELTRKKYGDGTYQELKNEFYRNTRDNFLIELGKYGLGKKDVVPNVTFFAKIVADESGNLSWVDASAPGRFIDLRAEMDVLTVLSNTPHPLDPSPSYSPKPIQITVRRGPPVPDDDLCRRSRPENERGFILTEAYAR